MSEYLECLLKRKGGSYVSMGDDKVTYHFRPIRVDGPHIALVEDEDVKVLLGIPEAYREADADEEPLLADNTLPPEGTEDGDGLDKPPPGTDPPLGGSRSLGNPDIPPVGEYASLSTGALADQYTQLLGYKPLKGTSREELIAAIEAARHAKKAAKKPTASPATQKVTPKVDKNGGKAVAKPPAGVQHPAGDEPSDEDLRSEYVRVFGGPPAQNLDRNDIIAALKAVQE